MLWNDVVGLEKLYLLPGLSSHIFAAVLYRALLRWRWISVRRLQRCPFWIRSTPPLRLCRFSPAVPNQAEVVKLSLPLCSVPPPPPSHVPQPVPSCSSGFHPRHFFRCQYLSGLSLSFFIPPLIFKNHARPEPWLDCCCLVYETHLRKVEESSRVFTSAILLFETHFISRILS